MTEQDNRPAAHNIYGNHVKERKTESLATELWGHIAHTMGEAADLLPKVKAEYGETTDELESIKGMMKNNLRKMGLLTGKTKNAIDNMHNGVVEAGQQPNFMGGPGLVLNKISYAISLARIRSTLTLINSPGVTIFLSVCAANIFSIKVNTVPLFY